MISSDLDPCLDESIEFANKLSDAGTGEPTTYVVVGNLIEDYHYILITLFRRIQKNSYILLSKDIIGIQNGNMCKT